jgi:hypothetical protein
LRLFASIDGHEEKHMNVFPNGIPSPTGPDNEFDKEPRTDRDVARADMEPAEPMTPGKPERDLRAKTIGGTVAASAATGAAIGVAVAGPAGAVVGGTLGAVAGAAGGAVVGTAVSAAVTAGASPGKQVDSATEVDTSATESSALDPARPRPGDTRR